MHSAVQTAVVTIISYKPLSGLNFARYTGHYGSYMPSSPLGVYKPLLWLLSNCCLTPKQLRYTRYNYYNDNIATIASYASAIKS